MLVRPVPARHVIVGKISRDHMIEVHVVWRSPSACAEARKCRRQVQQVSARLIDLRRTQISRCAV